MPVGFEAGFGAALVATLLPTSWVTLVAGLEDSVAAGLTLGAAGVLTVTAGPVFGAGRVARFAAAFTGAFAGDFAGAFTGALAGALVVAPGVLLGAALGGGARDAGAAAGELVSGGMEFGVGK
ncbi:MAG: hypothetical protein R3E56_14455 [Burkholderiaceae bacterium]